MHVVCLQEHGRNGASYEVHRMFALTEYEGAVRPPGLLRQAKPIAIAKEVDLMGNIIIYKEERRRHNDRKMCGDFRRWPRYLELLLALHEI